MLTTRGRYALQVLIDLAEQENKGYISLKSIAERQNLPKKYLEQIVPVLVKEEMIDCAHGKSGGYRLNRPIEQYNVGIFCALPKADFLRSLALIVMPNLAPVSMSAEHAPCGKSIKI